MSSQSIEEIERWIGGSLPASYRGFLAAHEQDLPVGDLVVLYGRSSFLERNETQEVKTYAPGCVTIGNDSGGREVLLVLVNGQLGLVDTGSMRPEDAEPVAEDFETWLAGGCDLRDPPETPHPDRVDLMLLRPPTDGLKGLVRVLKLLDLTVPASQYRALLSSTPCRLARNLEYLRYGWRCAEYNLTDPCLGASEVDRPERSVTIAPRTPPRGAPSGPDLS